MRLTNDYSIEGYTSLLLQYKQFIRVSKSFQESLVTKLLKQLSYLDHNVGGVNDLRMKMSVCSIYSLNTRAVTWHT